MTESIYNNETKQYEVLFVSEDVNVVQTNAKSNIYVFVKIENVPDWIKVGTILSKNQITAISVTEGIDVKMSSSKSFSYKFKEE